jgi:hypothetical protein
MRGRKVREDEAESLLQAWSASGERMSAWCASRGLNWYSLSAFKGWRGVRTDPPAFAELVVATPVPFEAGAARYRVEVGPVTVEVGDDFREETLRRLLHAVRSC